MKKLCALGMIFLLALAAVCAQATDITELNISDYSITDFGFVLGFSKDGKVARMVYWYTEDGDEIDFYIQDLVTDEELFSTHYKDIGKSCGS